MATSTRAGWESPSRVRKPSARLERPISLPDEQRTAALGQIMQVLEQTETN
ncbi:hypothetical protein [Nocardioides nematodiphilus]|uniref:hypothetical protein n=1 Tax=Nocardioides nematodiphilus TaxID=2849669 RepID=UPI001CD9F446|nr:hypothetical protein [Nocardioides nematodiphilus]MCA1982968.1 hypothetical protein [Nocardioides nematodiphilus]